jgi:hypothetical protein
MRTLPIAGTAVVLCLALAAVPALADPKVQLTTVEKGTVIHKLSGLQEGTVTEYWKDFGRDRVEITESRVKMLGVAVDTHQKSIMEGDLVTTIDLDRHTVTRSHNPLYQAVVTKLQTKNGAPSGQDLYRSMGGHETGETARYANETCHMWVIEEAGSRICVTDDGIVLMSETKLDGKPVTRTAVEVRRGDPGPPEAYEVGVAEAADPEPTGAGAPARGSDMKMEELWKDLKPASPPTAR